MATALQPVTSFSEVVIATDFSQEADRALDYGKAIARRFGSELIAVHVAEPVNPIMIPEGGWYYDASATMQDEETTESIGQTLRAEGFKARSICVDGAVAEEIVKVAELNHADLVVTGSEARLGPRRWLHGSISEAVARKLKLPLLIVGPKAVAAEGKQWTPNRLLCAACMDHQGRGVVTYTSALAAQLGASWEVACDYLGDTESCEDWDSFKTDLQEKLPHAAGKSMGVHSAFLGRPYAECLTELARTRNADLLIIGRSHSLLKWSMLTSGTLPHLLAEAPCPILAIPEQSVA